MENLLRIRPHVGFPHPSYMLIGINNRDLNTFETTLDTTRSLAKLVPEDKMIVAESGLFEPGDLADLARFGARAFLIGESLMRQEDVAAATKRILSQPPMMGGMPNFLDNGPVSMPPLQPNNPAMSAFNSSSASFHSMSQTQQQENKKAATTVNIPKTWNELGSLNIDLDNLSLKNQPKKSAVPMNQMASNTPTSNPMSPSRMAGGGGAFAGLSPQHQPFQGGMGGNNSLI